MPKNVNSASRLVSLIKSIPTHPDNTQTVEVWALLFQVQERSPQRRGFVVSERLGATYRELDIVRLQMEAKDYSEELYAPAISRLEAAFSTMNLYNQWPHARQHLTAETMVALAFCAEIIDNEEDLIGTEELTEIANKVQELEECLEGTTLPPRLKSLMLHHIDLIRKALAEYPIAGARALRQAARTALGEIVEVREEISAHPNSREIANLGAVWKRVNSAADLALKADKIAQVGQKAWNLVEGFLPG
ncbi:hypothetical protein [Massilia sp. IC2-476]|uniref:hypothetical protein n=1 Tax=Massilia sp. IC2-476 TaxID=2887199 RepID=UPI001D10DDC5|nr:hypothetical protein [Massilia sp. IC2-476]MCC2975001.1 hypothetical protein [Massilia sp. IC2-476]